MRSRVCIAAALLVALAGCSGTDDPGGAGGDPATSSAAPSDPSSGSGSTSPTAGDGVEPADGQSVHARFLTYRLPGGKHWILMRQGLSAYLPSGRPGAFWEVRAFEFQGTHVVDLDQLAGVVLRTMRDDYPALRRVADRTVAGRESFVLEGESKDAYGQPAFYYRVGSLVPGGSWASLAFTFPKDTPQARDVIESVLASVRWTSS